MSTAPPDLDWEGPGLLGSAWRYRWLLVAAALAGGILGMVFSAQQPVRYEGVASVLLASPTETEPGFDAERNVQNQVGIMTSAAVFGEAAERQGGGLTVDMVRERVTVDASPDSDVVAIRALDPTPAGAAKLADSVALAYEDVLAERLRREAQAAIPIVQAQQARLRERLGQLQQALRADPGNPILEAERDTATAKYRQAQDEELQRERDLARRPAAGTALLQRAEIPTGPAQPQRARNVALGVLLFLVAAVTIAWTLAGRRTAVAGQPTATGRATPSEPPEAAAPAQAVEPADKPMLTPELVFAFDRLSTSLKDVMETLHLSGWNTTDQSLPQVEAETAANMFGLDKVAILLDDGNGRLEVAGDVGLSPPERRKAVRNDAGPVRSVLDTGPQLLGQQASAQLAKAGLPGGRAIRLVVPLVHQDVGFGLLLASPKPGNGSTGFDDGEVEAITAYANAIVPTLRSWILLGRLRLDLHQDIPAPASDGRPGARPAPPG